MRHKLLAEYLQLCQRNRTTARRRFEERDVDGQSFDTLYHVMLRDVIDLVGAHRIAALIDAHTAIDEHVEDSK